MKAKMKKKYGILNRNPKWRNEQMAHKMWCGKTCADCKKAMNNDCQLDLSMPCAPDCELLGEDGYPADEEKCKAAGCDAYEW